MPVLKTTDCQAASRAMSRSEGACLDPHGCCCHCQSSQRSGWGRVRGRAPDQAPVPHPGGEPAAPQHLAQSPATESPQPGQASGLLQPAQQIVDHHNTPLHCMRRSHRELSISGLKQTVLIRSVSAGQGAVWLRDMKASAQIAASKCAAEGSFLHVMQGETALMLTAGVCRGTRVSTAGGDARVA